MTEWQLGLQAFQEGRMKEAADRLRIAADDQDLTVTLALRYRILAYYGAALYSLGQPKEAIPKFEDALLLAPVASADMMFNLANAYLADGRSHDARRMLGQILERNSMHADAQMLLQRLNATPSGSPLTGKILGESPESVQDYLRTLSFSRMHTGGYDPAQVQAAVTQISHYIEALTAEVKARDAEIAKRDAEIVRYRQMEDAMIANIMKTEQNALTSG